MVKLQDSDESSEPCLELSLSLPVNPTPSSLPSSSLSSLLPPSQPPPQSQSHSNPPPFSASPAPPSPNPPPPSSATSDPQPPNPNGEYQSSTSRRARRSPKSDTKEPEYEWAKNRHATVYDNYGSKLCIELSLSLPVNPKPSSSSLLSSLPSSSSPSSSLSRSQPSPQPLSLSNPPQFSASPTPPSPNPPRPSSANSAPPPPNSNREYQPSTSGRRPRRARRPPKSDTIEPEYEWATNRRATVYSLNILRAKGIQVITGEVECRQCGVRQQINYDLEQKFRELKYFIMANMWGLHRRAPLSWMNPAALNCNNCRKKNCVKPLISQKKRGINWLFLLLGQMLGYCKLPELKYFCKHTKNHRTGAKDRLLYDVYVGLCRQLEPEGTFEI